MSENDRIAAAMFLSYIDGGENIDLMRKMTRFMLASLAGIMHSAHFRPPPKHAQYQHPLIYPARRSEHEYTGWWKIYSVPTRLGTAFDVGFLLQKGLPSDVQGSGRDLFDSLEADTPTLYALKDVYYTLPFLLLCISNDPDPSRKGVVAGVEKIRSFTRI